MSEQVLNIQDLSISTVDKELVKKINLTISEGEIHALIGESGSGKSLTALSIVQMLPPQLTMTAGKIQFNSDSKKLELTSLQASEIRSIRGRDIGFVFQDPMTSLNPSMRCGRQVEEVLGIHKKLDKKERKEKVLDFFEITKLPDPEKAYRSYPHELSGGQRQRVMIASAIICEPKLMIADEITTALDVTVQKSILQLIDEMREKFGMSVLFISHDLGLTSEIADQISVMYHGEIMEQGSSEQIIKTPANNYTKGLLACRPPMHKKVLRLPTLENPIPRDKVGYRPISSSKLLSVRNLKVYYTLKRNWMGKVTKEMEALKGVSFDIKLGETMGLVGESGSGKSTLGRSLLKLIEMRSGSIKYGEREISALTEKEFHDFRRKIQFVFQDPYASLNPRMKVFDILLEPIMYYKLLKHKEDPEDRVFELLNMVGLKEEDAFKYPHEFSGGQRQRIVIARALSVRPEFVVFDEAVSALDVSVQAVILNLLKDLKFRQNLTYLFITHDMAVVRFFCDKIIVMKDGEIVEEGNVDPVFHKPKHEFTKKLIESSF
jgi:peptide/nickel transport system ATP-binding protein